MELLKEKILREGVVAPGGVLKVGSFLNQQMDVPFLMEVGKEFYRRFQDAGVTKILTIEASGIGIACLAAVNFGCPVIFAKKSRTSNINGEVYFSMVNSYTHGNTYDAVVPKAFLQPEDKVLILDDFLAVGSAMEAMMDIVEQAGATLVGAGSCIEKVWQGGGDKLRRRGIRVESLAKISSMDENGINFED